MDARCEEMVWKSSSESFEICNFKENSKFSRHDLAPFLCLCVDGVCVCWFVRGIQLVTATMLHQNPIIGELGTTQVLCIICSGITRKSYLSIFEISGRDTYLEVLRTVTVNDFKKIEIPVNKSFLLMARTVSCALSGGIWWNNENSGAFGEVK